MFEILNIEIWSLFFLDPFFWHWMGRYVLLLLTETLLLLHRRNEIYNDQIDTKILILLKISNTNVSAA